MAWPVIPIMASTMSWSAIGPGDGPVKTDLFAANTGGYAIYRVPDIVTTPKGSLLVYCEARRSRSDWAAIDPLYRRSTDRGLTWTAARKLPLPVIRIEKNPAAVARGAGKHGDRTVNNIVMIADPASVAGGVATSPDGATRWTRPRFDPALVDPVCMASICRLTASGSSDRNRLVFSNPNDGQTRRNLTIRLSYDEGGSWPVARTLEPGVSAYSDLAAGPDGALY